MRLLYATSIDFPSTRANRLQTVSMARAFHSRLGESFVFGIHACEKGVELGVPYRVMPRRRSFFLALDYLRLAHRESVTHVYCREERLLALMLFYNFFFRHPCVFAYELHHLTYLRRWVYRKAFMHLPIVSITQAMKDVMSGLGVSVDKVCVAPDAVDVAFFEPSVSKEQARTKLALPQDAYVVLYAGSIHEEWKGVGTLYEAACRLGLGYVVVIVGGKPHYVEAFQFAHPARANVWMVGHRPHAEIPLYLRAADAAVVPNSARAEISRLSTSPMKLFEYMAARVPIVASDLESMKEVVDRESAVLVRPDDPEALAEGIRSLKVHPDRARIQASRAYEKVRSQTWEFRAETVVDFLRKYHAH